MPSKKYTYEILLEAVAKSKSFRDTVIKLGVIPHGGNISLITKRIIEEKIDYSHFLGKHWNSGNTSKQKRLAKDILVKGKIEEAYRLRRALLESHVDYSCAICKCVQWMNKPINLQIDHINGDKKDNTIENLRFICPNCHSQTENFCFCGRKHNKFKQ